MDGGCRLARIVLLATLVAAVAAPAASASQVIEIEIPARGGEISDQQLCGYTGPPRALVRLPDGYNRASAYPLLVLLKGAGGNYKSTGDARVAAGLGAIVVIPEGCTGWDVDWWNGGRRGAPAWESYFLDQVIPQVRERFRIRPERRYHALAGISMGGLGTAYLGGRLPGFFGSIAIISGLVDGHVYPGEGAAKYAISQGYAGAPPDDPEAVEGPPDGFYSFGHDPVHLAANLRQTRVYMASGDGTPAGADSIGPTMGYNAAAEGTIIRPASDHYAAALQAAGIDFRYDRHAGLHDGPNFDRELKDAIGWGLFAPVDEHPTSWVNDTVATHGKLWQFAYRFDAPPDRIVRFRRTGARLAVGAAGSPVRITTDGGCVIHFATPAVIDVPKRPCARLAVSVTPRRVRAGRPARIRVRVTPAVAGARVSAGARRATTNGRGSARLRVCVDAGRRVRVRVSAPDYRSAATFVRARAAATPRRVSVYRRCSKVRK